MNLALNGVASRCIVLEGDNQKVKNIRSEKVYNYEILSPCLQLDFCVCWNVGTWKVC